MIETIFILPIYLLAIWAIINVACPRQQPIIPCTAQEIRTLRHRFFINNGFDKSMKTWGSYIKHGIAEPLCGWEYLRDYGDLVPQCIVEVIAYGVRNKIIIRRQSPELIKELARSMLHGKIDKEV